MTLPVFQFRDRVGEPVNLSTVDDRDVIAKAELYHILDVGQGIWCRPCGSTGCVHATQIEEILATAGLGRSRTGYNDLPGIARIMRYCATGEMVVACWFDNDARVRFHEQGDGTVIQSVFGPDEQEREEMTEKSEAESAPSSLVATLAIYCQHRQRGDFDGMRQHYPELARIVGESDTPTQTMD